MVDSETTEIAAGTAGDGAGEGSQPPRNFGVVGVAGYIAPRHLRAIVDTGNNVVAAVDPHDAVGLLDSYGFDISFFTEFERFDRHLEKLRRTAEADRVHFLSVCSPNYLHDAHCRLALRVGADAICEKPVVLNPWNVDLLRELEAETGRRIYPVLQLRLHPRLRKLRQQLQETGTETVHDVDVTYISARGAWYGISWKGHLNRSGGIASNIGIHFFDLLLWLFGSVVDSQVHINEPTRMAGTLRLERARVRWFLSVDPADLELIDNQGDNARTHRSIRIDGEEIEFTEGFADLHTEVYREVLAGRGLSLDDARPSIQLTHDLRTAPLSSSADSAHHLLQRL